MWNIFKVMLLMSKLLRTYTSHVQKAWGAGVDWGSLIHWRMSYSLYIIYFGVYARIIILYSVHGVAYFYSISGVGEIECRLFHVLRLYSQYMGIRGIHSDVAMHSSHFSPMTIVTGSSNFQVYVRVHPTHHLPAIRLATLP